MTYKIGEKVECLIYILNGHKHFFVGEFPTDLVLEKMSFEIISINKINATSDLILYTLLIPDEVSGWVISQWRIDYQNIDPKFLNKKFYEIGEYFLNRKIVEPELVISK